LKRISTAFRSRSRAARRWLAGAAIVVTLAVSAAVLLRFREPPLDAIYYGGTGPPTVVLLHGYGAIAEDWEPFLQTVTFPPDARLIFPKGPSIGGLSRGRGWWNLDLTTAVRHGDDGPDLSRQKPPGIRTAARLVRNLLADVEGPVILGGFSQGAMLSAEIAFQTDQPLAALILLSGTTVNEAAWVRQLPRRKGLAVFMAHGRFDGTLSFQNSDRFRAKLQAAGLDVTWLPFDGGHEIPAEVVVALNAFLLRTPIPGP
jgi:phospholipase/carboxylesterase